MNIKGVIFDMDGLMLDTEKLLTRFWREAAAFYGFNMTKDHVLSIRSLSGNLTKAKLQRIFGTGFDYAAVRQKRIELMNDHIEKNGVEKKKGLDELLDYLRKNGFKTAVATATDFKRTENYLKKAGIIDKFDQFVCGDMIKKGKPAPDIYIAACQELDLKPEECIALEDSPNGILSAYQAGCMPIMVPDLSEPDEQTKKLLYAKISSLDKLIDILKV